MMGTVRRSHTGTLHDGAYGIADPRHVGPAVGARAALPPTPSDRGGLRSGGATGISSIRGRRGP